MKGTYAEEVLCNDNIGCSVGITSTSIKVITGKSARFCLIAKPPWCGMIANALRDCFGCGTLPTRLNLQDLPLARDFIFLSPIE
jgi:hypothetical protein